ncbi:hypothetical protein [Brasilonema sp. UFV-L1]|uniref:hypothetical protein n=1 Tax=Brasilonema sp. UFV-L1 TaxID=2234130 RepID=UPI001B7CDC27|nr:hypothetical protein [Brasilonema sp. UFV-L1]
MKHLLGLDSSGYEGKAFEEIASYYMTGDTRFWSTLVNSEKQNVGIFLGIVCFLAKKK